MVLSFDSGRERGWFVCRYLSKTGPLIFSAWENVEKPCARNFWLAGVEFARCCPTIPRTPAIITEILSQDSRESKGTQDTVRDNTNRVSNGGDDMLQCDDSELGTDNSSCVL